MKTPKLKETISQLSRKIKRPMAVLLCVGMVLQGSVWSGITAYAEEESSPSPTSSAGIVEQQSSSPEQPKDPEESKDPDQSESPSGSAATSESPEQSSENKDENPSNVPGTPAGPSALTPSVTPTTSSPDSDVETPSAIRPEMVLETFPTDVDEEKPVFPVDGFWKDDFSWADFDEDAWDWEKFAWVDFAWEKIGEAMGSGAWTDEDHARFGDLITEEGYESYQNYILSIGGGILRSLILEMDRLL